MIFSFITTKSIYTNSIYSKKCECALIVMLCYGYPMGMLWLSYGKNG